MFSYGARMRLAVGASLIALLGTACSGSTGSTTTPVPIETLVSKPLPTSIERDANVPELPFPDNSDPNACGIPSPMGDYPGWVNGVYEGQVIEPTVILYDSHERRHITGALPSGTAVHVELYQNNPVLDFYYVRADTAAGSQKGWVPAPFLQFNPPPLDIAEPVDRAPGGKSVTAVTDTTAPSRVNGATA